MIRRSADAEELEALLSGEGASEDAPRSLARLASLATAVRDHTELETPSDDFRLQLRAELLTTATAAPPSLATRLGDRVDAATARVRHSLRVAGAAAVASSMIGTAGVAAAAQSALPGDALYSVKGFTEQARLALASGDVERGRLHLAFAEERLEEVELGRERLTDEQLTETLADLDVEAATGADEMLAAATVDQAGATALLDELGTFTQDVRRRLLDLSGVLPLGVQPATENTLEVLRRIDLQVTHLRDPDQCEVCAQGAAATGSPRVVLPGDGPALGDCSCIGVTDDGEAGTDDAPTPQDEDADAPVDSPVDGGVAPRDTGEVTGGDGQPQSDRPGVDDLVEPLDDVGTIVDELVPGPPTGGVDDAVDDVQDTATELGDTASEAVDTVQDTASEAVDAVEDAASRLGGQVQDLGDGLTN